MAKRLGDKLYEVTELCIDILAHSENDMEWTSLGGNGTNPSEAANVAESVMEIINGNTWEQEFGDRIKKRASELRREYGHDDPCGDDD